MSLTEIIEGMARTQRSEAQVLMQDKLSPLYQEASALYSDPNSDIKRLVETDVEIDKVRAEVRQKELTAQALSQQVLPDLLTKLHDLGLSEPPVEFLKQLVASLPPTPDENTVTEVAEERGERVRRHYNKMGLTEKQMLSARVVLRLTDTPGEHITAQNMIREFLPDIDQADYSRVAGQIYGGWESTKGKLVRLMEPVAELVFPIPEDQIQALELDPTIKDILARVSRVPRYNGLTFEGVLEYYRTHKHEPVNLIPSEVSDVGEMAFSDSEKIFWAYCLCDSGLDFETKRSVVRLLQKATGSVNPLAACPVFEAGVNSLVFHKLSRYLLEENTEEANQLFDEMDVMAQTLIGATAIRLRGVEASEKSDVLAKILKLDIASSPSDTFES